MLTVAVNIQNLAPTVDVFMAVPGVRRTQPDNAMVTEGTPLHAYTSMSTDGTPPYSYSGPSTDGTPPYTYSGQSTDGTPPYSYVEHTTVSVPGSQQRINHSQRQALPTGSVPVFMLTRQGPKDFLCTYTYNKFTCNPKCTSVCRN